ncbi:MAG: phosphatidylcholine/phosphatidylserine synthase [Pyrinomonadaceae bacterium]
MENDSNQTSHKGLKKGLFLIPTSFTAANIAMGFLAILASLRGFQVVISDPERAAVYFNYAAVAIGLAILFDTLDGRLARMTKTSTELGVQLDSLADVLTFGIAPVTLLYGWGLGSTFSETSSVHRIGVFVLFTYLMCGVLRLARFNLQATRPRVLKEGTPKVDKKNFVGLPIPPAAGLIAAVIHFAPFPLSYYGETYGKFYATLILLILPVLAGLMVCTIKYTSFKNVGTGKRNLYLILVLGAVGMLIWLYSHYVLLAIAVAYVSHGLIWYLLGLFRLRKKAAEDEEDAEDE